MCPYEGTGSTLTAVLFPAARKRPDGPFYQLNTPLSAPRYTWGDLDAHMDMIHPAFASTISIPLYLHSISEFLLRIPIFDLFKGVLGTPRIAGSFWLKASQIAPLK